MENGGNVYNNGHINRNKGQTSSNTILGWDMFEPNTSRFDWASTSNATTLFTTATAVSTSATGESTSSTTNSLIFPHQSLYYQHHDHHYQQLSLYAGEGLSHLHPDPHLMCLKLGKRHYFEDTNTIPASDRDITSFSIGKRGKPYYSVVGSQVGPSSSAAAAAVPVPRCQVEGCHVALVKAKDYHRRHKVCEMHSKASNVIVLGLEQRFCQQCSRFHVVSEFDDAKRSCRRRLAGHNERRRKSAHDSVSRNSCQDKYMSARFPYLASPTGRALSLLSSKADSWISSSDLSSRSSAALRELIAENRAAILTRQLVLERHLHHNNGIEDLGSDHSQPSTNNSFTIPHHNWDRFHVPDTQVTLDLMQTPNSAFGFLSAREKNKDDEQECSEL
eukprot:XP_015583063.1 squamosa promoter-binding-like protein 7 [Ricinus communis]